MRRTAALVVALALAFIPSALAGAPADPIRVHVRVASQAGFTDPGTADSVKDLTNALQGKDIIRVVSEPAAADVILEVQTRGKEYRGKTSTYVNRNAYTGQVMGASSNPEKSKVVYVKLMAGNFEKDLEGIHQYWSRAAKDVAKQTEAWIKTNQTQLRQARANAKD